MKVPGQFDFYNGYGSLYADHTCASLSSRTNASDSANRRNLIVYN
jgi:hypothetical protein